MTQLRKETDFAKEKVSENERQRAAVSKQLLEKLNRNNTQISFLQTKLKDQLHSLHLVLETKTRLENSLAQIGQQALDQSEVQAVRAES